MDSSDFSQFVVSRDTPQGDKLRAEGDTVVTSSKLMVAQKECLGSLAMIGRLQQKKVTGEISPGNYRQGTTDSMDSWRELSDYSLTVKNSKIDFNFIFFRELR